MLCFKKIMNIFRTIYILNGKWLLQSKQIVHMQLHITELVNKFNILGDKKNSYYNLSPEISPQNYRADEENLALETKWLRKKGR